jgi:transcriptional regulator with XRE-family HTH domain
MAWGKNERKKSFVCNGDLVRRLRKNIGWSQKVLAQRSGYSERLIFKAESGGKIKLATLEVLAETLCSSDRKVGTRELIADPLQIAKSFTEAIHVHKQDAFAHIEGHLSEQVVFAISGDPAEFPYAGLHRGREEVRRAFEILFSVMMIPDDPDWSKRYEYFVYENDVVIWGQCRMHRIGDEPGNPIPVTQRLKFRKGKICLFEDRFEPNC